LAAALQDRSPVAHLQLQTELGRIFQLIDDGSRFPTIDVREIGGLA